MTYIVESGYGVQAATLFLIPQECHSLGLGPLKYEAQLKGQRAK